MIAKNLTELIGNTPLLQADRFAKRKGIDPSVTLLAKLEYFNPSSSVKDRAAFSIIKDAIAKGQLQPGGTIVEATSGNMGIGLASIAAAMGYKMVVTMPETMSVERQKIMKQLGVELILTPGAEGMAGAVKEANKLAEERGGVLARQFDNPANAQAHVETTGPEIWDATDGKLDYFVAGIGTGGTVMGTGKYLKSKNSNIQIVGIEPATSAVLSGKPAGKHGIQGLGAGFVPGLVDVSKIDKIMQVETEDAIKTAQEFTLTEGALVGISSGAALHAAVELITSLNLTNKTVVVLLPDTGERYLSTALFA